jgi:outer membrane protein TolC
MTEQESIAKAMAENGQIRRLQSNLNAKLLEMKSYRAEKLPKINLVSQYMVLAKYNNYEQYFGKFQRNNLQIGASIEIPIFRGKASGAFLDQTQIDIDKIRLEIQRTQTRVTADIKQSYADVTRSEERLNLMRDKLDLASDDLKVLRAQQAEGRATMAQVEAGRAAEQKAWIEYYEALRVVDVAKLNVLRNTGTLLASVRPLIP